MYGILATNCLEQMRPQLDLDSFSWRSIETPVDLARWFCRGLERCVLQAARRRFRVHWAVTSRPAMPAKAMLDGSGTGVKITYGLTSK